MSALAPALFPMPLVGLYPTSLEEANRLLVQYEHKLGPVNRPFRSEAFALTLDDRPVAVAVSASMVSSHVSRVERQEDGTVKVVETWHREETVELARLAGERWATRVMVRLWREVCAPRWHSWPVRAAISYSHNAMHSGNLYRFDGWERIRADCGSSGGGSWSRQRYATEAVHGKKTLWLWRYQPATAPAVAPESDSLAPPKAEA